MQNNDFSTSPEIKEEVPSSEIADSESEALCDEICASLPDYDDEEYDTELSDEEYDADFEHRRSNVKTRVMRFLFGKKYLGLCFLIPLALMALIYVALGVWPVGERSALVLDLNAQYVYYIEKFRSILTDGGSFLYSFERALGGEFMGIFAYYLASPFNLLTILFPKEWMTEVVLAILLLKCGACGFTFGVYLHSRGDRRRPIANIIFACMYALCSFAVVMQNNLMWTDCIILFPIVLVGLDRLIKHGRYKLYTLSLALAVFTNFYIGYMMCLFLAIYFFVRYFSMTREERNPDGRKLHFIKTLLRIALFSVIAVMIAAVVITSAYYSLSFGKLEFSEPDFTPEQLYDFTDIVSKLFFGTYDTVRPEGVPFLYAGMLMTLLMPLYFFLPDVKTRKKVGAGFMLLLFTVSINLTTADLIWHGFQRPNWLNARFTFMFVLLMLVMAYDVLIRIDSLGFKKVVASGAVCALALFVLQAFELENMPDFRCIWASLGIIGIYLVVLRFSHSYVKRSYVSLPAMILAIVVCTELFASGIVDLYAFDADVTYSKRKYYRSFLDTYYSATEYVDENAEGFYREEKISHRKTNDNFALGIKGISNSTSTLNTGVIKLLHNLGFTSKSHWSKYVGGTPFTDSLLGIKYIYADKSQNNTPPYIEKYYNLIYESEEGVAVYENPYALSVAFEASKDIEEFTYDDDVTVKNPFEFMNKLFALTTGEEELTLWDNIYVASVSHNGNNSYTVNPAHALYEKIDENTTATVTYEFYATSTDTVYMYIPSTWPKKATFSVVATIDTNPDPDAVGIITDETHKTYIVGKTYFTNDTHGIVELGAFEPGQKVSVMFTQAEEKMYVGSLMNFFYSLNSEAFESTAEALSPSELDVTLFEEDRIEGTITTSEDGTVMLTTIPYDEGWHITVDGEEIEYSKSLDSLISFELDRGDHTVVMRYMSDEFKTGAIISISGILLFILICVSDKFLFPIIFKKISGIRKALSAKIRAKLFDRYDESALAQGEARVTAYEQTETNEGNEEK